MTPMGIDPSLSATGVAVRDDVFTIKSKHRGPQRLIDIRDQLAPHLAGVNLVAIEGYAYQAINNMAALGELGGIVRTTLYAAGIEYVDIAPATLKMYALGVGRGSKTDVIVAARERLGYEGTNDDEADALWLRAIAADLLDEPVVRLPEKHRRAITKTRELYQ